MKKHLKTVYGYNQFREFQKDIIKDLISCKDVFALLPTGGGKSLLYQYPATYTGKNEYCYFAADIINERSVHEFES